MFASWLRSLVKKVSPVAGRKDCRIARRSLALEALEDRQLLTTVLSINGGFVINNYAGVGFQENAVATLRGTVNGQTDTHASDFSATINWGDGSQWTQAGIGSNNGGSVGTFLIKGGHVYAQAGNYNINVDVTGPGGTTQTQQTAFANVSNMPSGIAGIVPPPVLASLAPGNVGLSINGGFVINNYAGVGFQENAVATLRGSVNGQSDPHASDFHAFINWGDSSQWFQADIASNNGGSVGTFLIKSGHVYAQAGQYQIVIEAIGPDGTTMTQQTAFANISNMPSGIPGIVPPPLIPSLSPSNVGLSTNGGFVINSDAGIGFQENAVATLSGSVNGQSDPHASDFHAFINWGDSNQWFQADVVPNTGGSGGSFLVEGSHVYAQPAQYDIVVYAIGPDGTSMTQQTAFSDVSANPPPSPPPPPPPPSGGSSPTPTPTLMNPVIAPIGQQFVQEGNTLSVSVSATPGNAGQTLTYSLGGGAPAGATIDAQTGLFTWTPQALLGQLPGKYAVPVAVTVNGAPQLNAAATFTINVTDVADPGAGFDAWQAVANGLSHSAEYYTNIITVAYRQYLGRTPDANGLAYWVNRMQQGLSDEQLEAGFIGSDEYIADHGGAGQNWVIGLYKDLLGRAPGADEVTYWVNNLGNGMSPQDVAFGFAASAEREGQRVTADYQQYLGRNPSSTEGAYWVNAFLSGMNNETVVAGFVGSQESFQSQGSNNVHDWLFVAYKEILNRPPDAGGAPHWLDVLGG